MVDTVKKLVNYMLNKVDKTHLRFHYLRVGKAEPILDSLREQLDDTSEIVHHEVNNFQSYHFPKGYREYNAAIVNMEINDEDIAEIRRDFWENFIWKTEAMAIPFALIIPNSNKISSLTKAQIGEAFSLIRLSDRVYKIFEHGEASHLEIMEWLTDISAIVHRTETESMTESESTE